MTRHAPPPLVPLYPPTPQISTFPSSPPASTVVSLPQPSTDFSSPRSSSSFSSPQPSMKEYESEHSERLLLRYEILKEYEEQHQEEKYESRNSIIVSKKRLKEIARFRCNCLGQ